MLNSFSKFILLLTNAVIPGIGPLFLGISNLSLHQVFVGIILLLVYMFTIILAINGDFLELETYTYLFKTVFNNYEGYYLERNVWLVVFSILISTITLYTLTVYYSYKASIVFSKSLSNSDRNLIKNR